MISLFFSRVHNGSFKGHNSSDPAGGDITIFLAPTRNWNFDTNFLVPSQEPPGTPFLEYVQVTGFRETNN